MSGYPNDLPKTRREMLRMGYTLLSTKSCRSCSTPFELWKTSRGKFLPLDLPAIAGNSEELTVLHREACTKAAADTSLSTAKRLADQVRSRQAAVEQLRRTSNARIVVAMYDDGAYVSIRAGIAVADLRHELITEANSMQRQLEAQRG